MYGIQPGVDPCTPLIELELLTIYLDMFDTTANRMNLFILRFNTNTQSITTLPIDWVVEWDGLVVVAVVVVVGDFVIACVVVVVCVVVIVCVVVVADDVGTVVIVVRVVDVCGGLVVVGWVLVVCLVCVVDATN